MSDETLYSSSSNMQVSSTPGTVGQPANFGNGADSFNQNPRPELEPAPFDKRPLWIGIGVSVGFLLLAILIGYLLFTHPAAAATFRDIFIIYMGIGIFVLIFLLILLLVILTYLVLKLNDLTQLITREVKPMLITIQNSLNTVNGTTNFISDNAVKPVISTVSSFAAAKAMVKTLFRR
jgi:hypothetical protein